MRVRFWGTRGSIATPGPGTNRFGGNTSCVEVVTGGGDRLILDCGTGARPLGNELLNLPGPLRANILLTHTHWDHIQGFPFFAPLFVQGNQICVYAPRGSGRSLADTLAGQMEFNYFPVELNQLPAQMSYQDLGEGVYQIGDTRVSTQYLNHPAMTLAYRIEADGASVVYACDHEMFNPTTWISDATPGLIESIVHEGDRRHARFLAGADLVIHDAEYTPEEYPEKRNWGHSTYQYAVEIAIAAGVKQLAFTHHDPSHDDAFIADIQRKARKLVAQYHSDLVVFAAYEVCEVTLGMTSSSAVVPAENSALPAKSIADGKRILVVDDDVELRALAKVALKSAGYIVLEACGGEEGIRMAEENHPDLVLLDLLMPKTDGLEVLARLRSKPSTSSLPVILLTAHSDESHTRAGFDAGASDYLAKPFTMPQLVARVTSCMARADTHEHHSADLAETPIPKNR